MTTKTIFLDRDGVINKEVGYLFRIADFEFIEGVFDACLYFQHLDYKIIIISNQSGIARGYFSTRDYDSKIGAWASEQSRVLSSRKDLLERIKGFKKIYPETSKVPRPDNWSGWILKPAMFEFWLEGPNRIHERLLYTKSQNGLWNKSLLSP